MHSRPEQAVARPERALRDVKLKLPMSHLVRLQSFRLIRRTSISQVLSEALDQYFATTARAELAALHAQVTQAEPVEGHA